MQNLTGILILDLIDISMLLMLLWLMRRGNTMDFVQLRSFQAALMITITALFADLASIVSENQGSAFRPLTLTVNVLGFSLSVLIPIALARVQDEQLYQNKLVFLPVAINVALAVSSPWTGWLFAVSSDNRYSRGPLFPVFVAAYIITVLILYFIWHREKRFIRRRQWFLLMLVIQFFLWSTIQVAVPSLHCTWHSTTLLLLLYYAFLREHQYRFDAVTNIFNRQAFDREMDRLERAGRAGVVLFDIDNFKKVNDTYGHQQGDYYLEKLASIICDSFGDIGSCYRIGGDEFCVLTEGSEDEKITDALNTMRTQIEAARHDDPFIPMVSYGTSIFTHENFSSIRAAMNAADENMYRYKSGRR